MRAMTATLGGRTHLLRSWILAAVMALLLTAGAGVAIVQAGHSGWPVAASLVAFLFLRVPYAAFLSTSLARDVGVWLTTAPALLHAAVDTIWVSLFHV